MDVIEDRKEHNRQQIAGLARWIAAAMVVPGVLLALIVVALTQSPLLTILALVVGYAATAGYVFVAGRGFGPKLLAALDIQPADEVEHARLHNLTEGLCVAHGLTKPDLYVLAGETRNAATIAVGDQDTKKIALVLSKGLLDALNRIELEGLLAQQLSHVRDGDTVLSTFVASIASLPGLGLVVAARAGSCLDPHGEQLADLAGVGLTRYPPGLADALDKVNGHSTVVPGVPPAAAHLWLADPLPEAEPFVPHPPLADRVLVLREL